MWTRFVREIQSNSISVLHASEGVYGARASYAFELRGGGGDEEERLTTRGSSEMYLVHVGVRLDSADHICTRPRPSTTLRTTSNSSYTHILFRLPCVYCDRSLILIPFISKANTLGSSIGPQITEAWPAHPRTTSKLHMSLSNHH